MEATTDTTSPALWALTVDELTDDRASFSISFYARRFEAIDQMDLLVRDLCSEFDDLDEAEAEDLAWVPIPTWGDEGEMTITATRGHEQMVYRVRAIAPGMGLASELTD